MPSPARLLARLRQRLRPPSPGSLPRDVEVALAELDAAAERFAASIRVAVILGLGVLLASIAVVQGAIDRYVALVYGLNLALSLLLLLRAQRATARVRPWLPLVLTGLDVLILLLMIGGGRFGRVLPGYATPALVLVWALVLVLALATLRGRPGPVALATTAVVMGLGTLMLRASELPVPADRLGALLEPLLAPGPNALRLGLLSASGAVLTLAALRARRTLVRALVLARERAHLGRYVPGSLVERLAAGDLAELRAGRVQPAAVLVADLRGFTAYAQIRPPAEVAAMLVEFRAHVSAVIAAHGGIVDKFIGDGVLAVFGIPNPGPADAQACLDAAHDLLARHAAWTSERAGIDRATPRLGIGLHAGPLFAGVLGDAERLEFTVIGDVVNVAQRLEQLTKTAGVDLVASGALLDAAGLAPEPPAWSAIIRPTLPGRAADIPTYGWHPSPGQA